MPASRATTGTCTSADSPSAWKRQLLADATIPIPDSLTFVPVDFERETLASALDASGFDPAGGAVFSWLGVVPYLSEAAIMPGGRGWEFKQLQGNRLHTLTLSDAAAAPKAGR